ncbi:MAG: FtsQ-type POTRA domain-containing protein [Armatimonadota bacterium]|nr:FtsQ-type POTRA domain-containing protein [Armatimonadota bacterium]MDR7428131.1 FtsQ-type POTRA domain-containing protein [Armatimonadota bacterium]MDR7464781.1 FtsQ-type POTRA domain-containing protein [Armatimonadota bacterium]MDR7470312.1 FtsQ-type POTRA domain-containing protein [Armatimonadota bacterium]MDR7475270.1 FtsQ-type POTRA domain-containing protein [Armatimonadota bacterium]
MIGLLVAASLPGSALFTLRHIEVEGAQRLSADAVRAASGLVPGSRSIFTVDAQEVAERLARHPWIAAARVRARPPHGILIQIRERTPVAAVPAASGYAVVDAAGVVLEVRASRPELLLVSERGSTPPWVAPGEEIPSAAVRAGLRLLPHLPQGLRDLVAHLQVTRRQEVFLYTVDGLEVRAGPLRGLRQRLADSPEILRTLRAGWQDLEYVDLSLPDQAFVKPRRAP